MKKWKKRGMGLLMASALSLATASAAFAGQWVKDGRGWWYQRDNGTYPVSEWMQDIDGKWYYFGGDGYILANTVTPDGNRVDQSGAWIPNGSGAASNTDNGIAYLKNSNSEYLIDDVQYVGDAGDSYKMRCDLYQLPQISPSLVSGKRAGTVFSIGSESYRITDAYGSYGGCDAVRVRDGVSHYFVSGVCPNGNLVPRYDDPAGGENWPRTMVKSQIYVYVSKNADIKWIGTGEYFGLIGKKAMSPYDYASKNWKTNPDYYGSEFQQWIKTDENGVIVGITALYED